MLFRTCAESLHVENAHFLGSGIQGENLCILSKNVSTGLIEMLVTPPMHRLNHVTIRAEVLEQLVQEMGDSCVMKRCLRRLAKQVVINR